MEHNYEEKLESFSGSRTAFVHWAAAIMLLVTVVAPISTRAQAAATFNYRPDLTARVISKHATGATAYKVVAFGSGDHLLTAEVVAPAVTPRKIAPGVLFVHWEGDRKTTNHTEFERDAAALTGRGVTSVLLDAHWSTFLTHGRVWFRDIRNFQTDYSEGVTQVIDLRRALDLLISLPGVDSSRVAYVGHDFGAMYGAVLAGVDQRVRYFVFLAAVPSLGHWMMFYKKPADVDAYLEQMKPLESVRYLPTAKAKGFLFQFADNDSYITADERRSFFEEAPPPRAMYVYHASHALTVEDAFQDRIAWLTQRLFP